MANILKITNKKQFERMVSLLEMYPDVARGKGHFGSSKQLTNEIWDRFTIELNSIGPPTRSSQEWQRVWIHYKANLKRKLVNNKKNLSATGGGPSQEISLSPLEKSVADLIKLHNSVAPLGRSFTVPASSQEIENDPYVLNCQLPNQSSEPPSRSPSHSCQYPTHPSQSPIPPSRSPSHPYQSPTHPSRSPAHPSRSLPNPSRRRNKRNNIEEERLNAITTQTKNQAEILQTLKVLEKTSYKKYLINKKTYELKKKKVALLEKQMAQASELHEVNMTYTKKKIEMLDAGYPA